MTLSLQHYWRGNDRAYARELTDEIEANAVELLDRVNLLLEAYARATGDAEQRTVNSGWRPAAVNARVPNAAVRSKHMTGQAIDIADPEGTLDEWCAEGDGENIAPFGLYLEHPAATKGWCHLQSVPPRSGKRVFYP